MDQDNIVALKQALSEDVVTVKFVKVNGTVRDMNCTLSKKHIPELPADQTVAPKSVSPTTTRVWDIDAGAWRSFKHESIISWQQNSVQN